MPGDIEHFLRGSIRHGLVQVRGTARALARIEPSSVCRRQYAEAIVEARRGERELAACRAATGHGRATHRGPCDRAVLALQLANMRLGEGLWCATFRSPKGR